MDRHLFHESLYTSISVLNEPPEVVEGVGNPGSMQPSSYHGVVHEPSVVAEIDQKPGGYPGKV